MMKHGHAKRVINSCPSYVSPFYRYARYRHRHVPKREREREKRSFLGTKLARFGPRNTSNKNL